MARPGEAPAPVFTGLPYGENALLNQMSEAVPEEDDFLDPGFDELAGLEPADDRTAFLFSETDRPDEPLTAGMSFGDGPNTSAAVIRGESKQDFAMRVAQELSASGGAIKGVQAFADRIARGL
jgi:hypothetical protein